MKRMYSIIEENKNIFFGLTVAVLIIFGIFIFGGRPLTMNPDQPVQYDIYYREWIRLVEGFINGEGLPLYSWNTFLGTDFYSTQVYPIIGDIFLPLLLLIEDIEFALFIETIICVYISAITMNMFLKEFGIKNKENRNFIAIIYAICGWAILFYGTYMFHRFYAFLPLMFFGIEYYLNKGKAYVFILSVTILLLQNYYLMFPTTLFVLIYGIFTTANRNYELKQILGCALKMIGFYLVGFMISAVVTIPGIISLLDNPRIGDGAYTSILWGIRTYLSIILSPIVSAFPILTGYSNLFHDGYGMHEIWYSLFIGIIPFISALKFILNKKNKMYLITIVVLLIIIMFKPLSSIMHGFSEPSMRLTMLLNFYILLCAAKGLDENDDLKKTFKYYMGFSFLAFLVLMMISFSNIELYIAHIINIFIYFIMAIIVFVTFVKNKKFGIILSVLYVSLSGMHMMYEFNKSYYFYDETIDKKFVEYFNSTNDDLMFRYYVNHENLLPSSAMNTNKPMDYGFMGLSTYNSVYDTNIIEFLTIEEPILWHIFDIDNPDLMLMLGVKYYIVNNEDELPSEYNFEYVYDFNTLKVYELKEFQGFGYSGSEIKYFSELDELTDFNNVVFVDEEEIDINQYKELEQSRFVPYEKGTNFLKGNINSSSDNILFLPIPNNPGWKIIVNGTEVDSISVNGGFMGIPIDAGENNVELYFVSVGFKEGAVISVIGVALLIIIEFINNKNRKTK